MTESIHTNPDFSFLGKKIMEINSAIFKAEADQLLLPNNVISTLRVDESGNIWFFSSCQKNVTPIYNTDFYSRLDYFNKEKNTRISVFGPAQIIPEMEAPDFVFGNVPASLAERQVLLIRFKIEKAECYNLGRDEDDPWLQKLKANFQYWLFTGSGETRKLTFDLTK